jgi:UrcA family protein
LPQDKKPFAGCVRHSNQERVKPLPEEHAMKSHIYRISLLGAVLGVFTMNVALADGAANHETNTGNVAVSFDDLNLAKPAGINSLHHRVQAAARKVCGVENFRVSLDIVRKNRECVSATIDSAMGKIDDSGLTSLHQKHLTLADRS